MTAIDTSTQLRRFLALEDVLIGFSDGIEHERLEAGLSWAKHGGAITDPLIRLFAAPWIAAAEEADWEGDAEAEARKQLEALAAQPSAGAQVERYVIVPLSRAPYADSFLDAVNGYATGGSGRCLEAIQAEGARIEATPVQPHTGDAWNVEHKLDEAEGFGASYIREEGKWTLYTMPGAKPFGAVDGYDKASVDFVMDALRATRTKPDTGDVAALRDIAAERQRQQSVEGWSIEHDDAHDDFELSRAASGYAAMPWRRTEGRLLSPTGWPWSAEWWKPKDNRSDLVRAGALIVAEIERLDRLAALSKPNAAVKGADGG